MLPAYKTDWRWLEGRADSPWYPDSIRLYRQPANEDWMPVIADIYRDLAAQTKRLRESG